MSKQSIEEVLSGGITQQQIRDRYTRLCAFRDATNWRLSKLKRDLEEANARVQAAQAEARAIAKQIQEERGGEKWLELKREIGQLASALRPVR